MKLKTVGWAILGLFLFPAALAAFQPLSAAAQTNFWETNQRALWGNSPIARY